VVITGEKQINQIELTILVLFCTKIMRLDFKRKTILLQRSRTEGLG